MSVARRGRMTSENIKIVHNGRSVSLASDALELKSFRVLKGAIRVLFPSLNGHAFSLEWRNENGKDSIRSTKELKIAMKAVKSRKEGAKATKIFVKLDSDEVSPSLETGVASGTRKRKWQGSDAGQFVETPEDEETRVKVEEVPPAQRRKHDSPPASSASFDAGPPPATLRAASLLGVSTAAHEAPPSVSLSERLLSLSKISVKTVFAGRSLFVVFSSVQFRSIPCEGGDIEAIDLTGNPIVQDNAAAITTLYLRHFYKDLLGELLDPRLPVSLLLGNPGTGKSMLQNVILAGLIIPPEKCPEHSTLHVIRQVLGHVDVVIQQRGREQFLVYLLAEGVVLRVFCDIVAVFFNEVTDIFHGLEVVFLFDPELTSTEVPYDTMLSCKKWVSTLPPQRNMYSIIVKKQGLLPLWMPLFTKSELITIGKDMASQPSFPPEMQALYTAEEIRKRYKHFGGVYHSVLPMDSYAVESASTAQRNCVNSLVSSSAMEIVTSLETLETDKSAPLPADRFIHKIILVDAAKDDDTYKFIFTRNTPRIIEGLDVKKKLADRLLELSIAEKRSFLVEAEKFRDNELLKVAEIVYEEVVRFSLQTGLEWTQRLVSAESSAYTPLSVHLPSTAAGLQTALALRTGELVDTRSTSNFPLADFYFKEGANTIAAVQVLFSKDLKEQTLTALQDFKRRLGIIGPFDHADPDQFRIRLILVPPHTRADVIRGFRYIDKHKGKALPIERFVKEGMLREVVIWKPPQDYSLRA